MRIVLIVVPVLLIAAVAAFLAWKILGLKQRLVAQLEAALHANAQIGSLNLDLGQGELLATNITLQNVRPDAPWDSGAIDQAAIHFHLGDIFGSTLPVQVEITGWKATLHTAAGDAAPPPAPARDLAAAEGEGGEPPAGAGPSRIRVNQVAATNGEVTILLAHHQTILIRGVAFHAETSGGADWTTQLQVSSIESGTFVTGAGSVQLHSGPDETTFTELAVHCGDGQISGSGDLALAAPHALKGSFTATSVPVTTLVTTRWQMKVSGLVSGSLTYQGDDTTATATGQLSVAGGKFSLFPWLGKATLLVGLPDITNMTIDQATADFSWKDHILNLQNIDVRKPDIFRIGGQASVAADETIDAHLKLGLPAGAVAKWPKLQTEIFTVTNDDFAWTDVHVTGTPDQLQEDLSPRLLSFGAEQGTDLLQQTKVKATDILNQLLK